MSTVASPLSRIDEARQRGREPGWWGMVLFVATEGALLGILLAAYFYVRVHSAGDWPQGGVEQPSLARPAVMTVLLGCGSATMIAAGRAAAGGAQGRLRSALLGTLLLGLGFLGLECWEDAETLDAFTPHTNAYGSLFYTVNGIHGAHVAVGVLLLVWTLALAFTGRITERRNLAVQNVALYWHFATVSWLAVFVSIYLSVAL